MSRTGIFGTYRKRNGKRLSAGILAVVMAVALLGGCGNNETADGNMPDDRPEGRETDGAGRQSQSQADGTAMGRYLEEVTDMSENLSGYRNGIYRLSDGRLVITDPEKHMLVSADDGITWEQDRQDWLAVILRDGFASEYNVGAEGSVGVVYMKQSPAGVSGTDSTESQNAALVVRPDGTRIDVTMPEQDVSPSHIWINDDGRIFLGTDGVDLYEVSEDRSEERRVGKEGSSRWWPGG